MSNSSHISIIKAYLTDVSWIVNLAYSQMNNYLEYAYNAPFDWENWENEMRGIIFSENYNNGIVQMFKLNINNKLIGFWWITPYFDHLWIDAFVIAPEYQNRGFGTQIIGQIKEIFQFFSPKNTKIELGVQNNNKKAISFYKKQNFEIKPDTQLEFFKTLRMVKVF